MLGQVPSPSFKQIGSSLQCLLYYFSISLEIFIKSRGRWGVAPLSVQPTGETFNNNKRDVDKMIEEKVKSKSFATLCPQLFKNEFIRMYT